MSDAARAQCQIRDVGKARSGHSRFWCVAHGANATGRYGACLSQCERAHLDIDPALVLDLDLERYPGGIALWASVDPIIDTTTLPPERGVHVHAREEAGGKKIVDDTFPAVSVAYKRDLIDYGRALITHETAVSYYVARFLGREITCLFCTYCGDPHLDAEFFAIKPHRRHLCHGCGRYFSVEQRTISNPLALARSELGIQKTQRAPVRATRALALRTADHPGGIQVWASNPAIIWTADRPEESGIHLHAYAADGSRDYDDTYGAVSIDGVVLDERQVAQLMAQQAVSHLRGKVGALTCPSCGAEKFDEGEEGFWPRANHECRECGTRFPTPGRRRLVVSNPIKTKLSSILGTN